MKKFQRVQFRPVAFELEELSARREEIRNCRKLLGDCFLENLEAREAGLIEDNEAWSAIEEEVNREDLRLQNYDIWLIDLIREARCS